MLFRSDTGSVDWRIYLIYYRSMGYALFSSCIFFYMVYQIFSTVASMWVAFWSDNQLPFEDISEQHNMTDTRRDIFLGVYGAAGFAQAISAVLASLMLYLSTITAGRAQLSSTLYSLLTGTMRYSLAQPGVAKGSVSSWNCSLSRPLLGTEEKLLTAQSCRVSRSCWLWTVRYMAWAV